MSVPKKLVAHQSLARNSRRRWRKGTIDWRELTFEPAIKHTLKKNFNSMIS